MTKTLRNLLLALVVILLSTTCALADTNPPPASEIAPNQISSLVYWRNGARSSDFAITYVEAGISVSGSGVHITGTTEANKVANSIGGYATIQRWENNTWKTYKQTSFLSIEASSCSLDKTISVDGGYYYRLEIAHTAGLNGEFKQVNSTTKSVFVN